MTRSEAGRLGYQKTKSTMQAHRNEDTRRAKQKWETENKYCPQCGKRIPYEKRANLFCNHSCRASFHNKGVRRHGKAHFCLSCGKPVRRKFCNRQCQTDFRYQRDVSSWLAEEITGIKAYGHSVCRFVRRWVQERDGVKCSVCGLQKWLGEPIPLVLDHVDGDFLNTRPKNLRLVCGNCNMQLPTFAGRNRGNGTRPKRIFLTRPE